jgi:hypothetical protein
MLNSEFKAEILVDDRLGTSFDDSQTRNAKHWPGRRFLKPDWTTKDFIVIWKMTKKWFEHEQANMMAKFEFYYTDCFEAA